MPDHLLRASHLYDPKSQAIVGLMAASLDDQTRRLQEAVAARALSPEPDEYLEDAVQELALAARGTLDGVVFFGSRRTGRSSFTCVAFVTRRPGRSGITGSTRRSGRTRIAFGSGCTGRSSVTRWPL